MAFDMANISSVPAGWSASEEVGNETPAESV